MKNLFKTLLPYATHRWFIALVIVFFFVGVFTAWGSVLVLPSLDNFHNRDIVQSTKIYDRTGRVLLFDVHGLIKRTQVPLNQISSYIKKATIAIEDVGFYKHVGIQPASILRALIADIYSGSFDQGGSTITQQVVKNTLLTPDKTILRKIKEIILALKLEQQYSKDEILETYLNEIPYGGVLYGVQEASQYFFGKSASEVTIAEAAYLAALPKAPTRYSPHGPNRAALDLRKNLVLLKMKDRRLITKEEFNRAIGEQVQFLEPSTAGIKAPHFALMIRDYLEEKYGVDAVYKNGLQVRTTLDYDLQKKAQDVITKGALKNEKNFNASNAGLVAMDPQTGQILAMVGSRGYFDEGIEGKVNVTLAERQPGSAFKPFVYATAFEKGYGPDTVVFDLKTQFSTACSPGDFSSEYPCYSPENFDGKFRGPITLRNAIAQSVNIPAVKVLHLAGIDDSLERARDFGITTLEDKKRYGLSLVLGGGEVKLLEMVGAYGVFANDGVRNPPTGILEVRDAKGNLLEQYKQKSTHVIEPEIARTISDVLSDNEARAPEFGSDSPLHFPGVDVADKTGTTNDYRDAWVIGYTPRVVVGAWAGNNDNTPMVKRIAAFIIAPLWHEVMAYAISKYPAGSFIPPDYDSNIASLPVLRGEWNTDPAHGIHDILYWTNKTNDSQFAHWEYPVQAWASQYLVPMLPIAGDLPTTTVAAVEQIVSQ